MLGQNSESSAWVAARQKVPPLQTVLLFFSNINACVALLWEPVRAATRARAKLNPHRHSRPHHLAPQMGGKRKAGALPEEILQVPAAASRSGAPPLAVYFPSGFDPNKHSGECSWATYAHKDKKSQFTVVAATVRHGCRVDAPSRRSRRQPHAPARPHMRERAPPAERADDPLLLPLISRTTTWTLWGPALVQSTATRLPAGKQEPWRAGSTSPPLCTNKHAHHGGSCKSDGGHSPVDLLQVHQLPEQP